MAPSPYDATMDRGKKVILHFHGGAYVVMSPRMAAVQYGPRALGKEMSAVVLCV